MRALVQQELDRHAGLLIRLIHQVEFLGSDVRIVQAVHDECRALDVFPIQRVIAGRPVLAVVAVECELIVLDLIQILAVAVGDGGVIVRVEITAGAVPCEPVAISDSAGGNALGVGVFIPACNAGDGDDGLQTFHAGGSQTELGGAGVGAAGHTDLAGGPIRRDGEVTGLVGVSHTVAVQPFDHALERVNLQIGAAGLKALGALGAETAAFDNSEAAHEIVIIPSQILVIVHILVLVPVIPIVRVCVCNRGGRGVGAGRRTRCGLVIHAVEIVLAVHIGGRAGGAAGDVRTRFVNGRNLQAVEHLVRELDQRLDEVELAVAVGVVVGLNINAEADNTGVAVGLRRVGILKDRLRNAVHEQGLPDVLVHGVIERLHILEHGVELVHRAKLGGGPLDVLGQADALRHGVIVVGIGAELRFLHAGIEKQKTSRFLLRNARCGFRRFLNRHGDCFVALHLRADRCQIALLEVLFPVINSQCRGEQRQSHHHDQEKNCESLFHDLLAFFLRLFERYGTPLPIASVDTSTNLMIS